MEDKLVTQEDTVVIISLDKSIDKETLFKNAVKDPLLVDALNRYVKAERIEVLDQLDNFIETSTDYLSSVYASQLKEIID